MTIRENKYELSHLQHIFLGPKWTILFLCITICDWYVGTWLICTIFGQALAEKFPLAMVTDDYKLWVGVFILITIPLSCTSILDQALLQFIFLAGRMLMVFFMAGTLIVAFIHSDRNHFGDQMGPANDVPLVDFTHTITIIQTAIYTTSFQCSVPGIAGISSNKKTTKWIFRNAITFTYLSNSILALLSAVYFGSSTNPSSNLNWSTYHSGDNGWSLFVSGYIVLFAAIDGLAVFPLMCCSLGDIMLAGFYGEKAHLAGKNVKTRIFFRLVASVPQSICALFVNDLGSLVIYGGILTLISESAVPTVLYIVSGRSMKEQGLTARTFFSSKWFSKDWLAYFILTTALFVVAGVVLDSVLRSF